MKIFKVSVTETLYHVSKRIEATTEKKAIETYMEMFDSGNTKVVDCDIPEINCEEEV